MKPLLIGEQPSKHGDPSTPLEGRIGRRLADYCAISYEAYLEKFERMNLLDARAEYSGHNHTFNLGLAKVRADELIRTRFKSENLFVLVCGKRAAKAFGISTDYFAMHHLNNATLVVIPHPSGANRWYNKMEHRGTMRVFMRSIARQIGCVQIS